MSILLDAGPMLNFLAVGQQTILIHVAESHGLTLQVPQRVEREVLGMAKDPRFARTPVAGTWGKLKAAGRITILDDSLSTIELADAVSRVSGVPSAQRVRQRKSLGEILVIAHASVYAQRGVDVFVLIDERDGRARANRESEWLVKRGHPPLTLWSTRQILRDAAGQPDWIGGSHTWDHVYDQMRLFDDGLPPRQVFTGLHR